MLQQEADAGEGVDLDGDRGGYPDIDAMKETGGHLTLTSRLRGDHELVISVSDTGGLPSENPEQIFESFVTTKTDGTGMGLAISRSIRRSPRRAIVGDGQQPAGVLFHQTIDYLGRRRHNVGPER